MAPEETKKRRLKKTRFRICVLLGVVIVILVLTTTSFYGQFRNFHEDDPGDMANVFKARLWGPTHYWLFERWGWQPTNSGVANVTIAILHVISIALAVPVVCFLIWFLYVFAYLLPLFVGALLGCAAAFLANAFSIMLGKVGAGFTQVSYEAFAVKGGLIALYAGHAILIGFSLYFITPLFQGLALGFSGFFKLAFKPLLVGTAVIYDSLSKRKAVKTRMSKKRRGEVAVSSETQVLIPQVFDEGEIEAGLLKYRSDKRLLGTFLSGLAERYKDESQIKVIRKKLEKLNLGKEYLETLYQARQAYSKLAGFDDAEELEKQKLTLEKKKLEAETQRVDLEEEVKRKQLEFDLAKIEADLAEIREGKKEIGKEEKDQELVEDTLRKIANTIAIKTAEIEGAFQRAALLAEQEKKIREKYSSDDAERIIDLVERIMAREEDVG